MKFNFQDTQILMHSKFLTEDGRPVSVQSASKADFKAFLQPAMEDVKEEQLEQSKRAETLFQAIQQGTIRYTHIRTLSGFEEDTLHRI